MALVAFANWVDDRFGLSVELVETIGCREAESCAALLDDPDLSRAGLAQQHLLVLRRAWRRYRALSAMAETTGNDVRSRLDVYASRHGSEPGSFVAAARMILERGRLRFHVKDLSDPRAESVAHLAEHTEGCDELPPHRWLAARRGVADGVVWIEVIPPEDVEAELARTCESAVLDAIALRSETAAIDTAAGGLYALLSRAPIDGAVGGVLVDRKRVFLAVSGGEHDGEQAELDTSDTRGVLAWLRSRAVAHVGLSRLGGSSTSVQQALAPDGVAVEPVRETGLMKQAKKRGGAIKLAAALVVAERLRDPIEGYAGLEPDELGLGEYLDRVDADRLHAALTDVRDVVAWERQHGKSTRVAGVGVSLNPMVKSVADLRPGMEMSGVVANLTHFGAFVELGLAAQGLVHVSQLTDKFVKHPSEVVQVGDRVRVRVLDIDEKRERISLTMRSGEQKGGQRGRDARKDSLAALDALFKK